MPGFSTPVLVYFDRAKLGSSEPDKPAKPILAPEPDATTPQPADLETNVASSSLREEFSRVAAASQRGLLA